MSAPAAGDAATLAACRRIIARGSRSFALASRLLPRAAEEGAIALYAFCRRADDAIDLAAPAARPAALARLEAELEGAYAGAASGDVALDAFAAIVRRAAIPRRYPAELLAGLAMDVAGTRYATEADLLRYAYRVAGTVGLMMSHVMGVRDERALENAAHLGVAMQLTNVCRDVADDWALGRLYLPADLLARHGAPALGDALGGALPIAARPALAAAVRDLLALADRYYASGVRGLPALGWREALAVDAARRIYAAIGERLADGGFDVFAGRAVVPAADKLRRVAAAGRAALAAAGPRARRPRAAFVAPRRELRFPDDVAAP